MPVRDGDVDYSRYSMRELEEALSAIDRARFPGNYAKLCAAHRLLAEAPPAPALPSQTEASAKAQSLSGAMDVLSQAPERPWRAFWRAIALGPILGCALVSLFVLLFDSSDSRPRWVIVADVLPASLFAYGIVLPVALVYALPLLWLALRRDAAGPLTAIAAALLPGLLLSVGLDNPHSALFWLPLSVSFATTCVFVCHAYRWPRASIERTL